MPGALGVDEQLGVFEPRALETLRRIHARSSPSWVSRKPGDQYCRALKSGLARGGFWKELGLQHLVYLMLDVCVSPAWPPKYQGKTERGQAPSLHSLLIFVVLHYIDESLNNVRLIFSFFILKNIKL
jgi:hypothetical protein